MLLIHFVYYPLSTTKSVFIWNVLIITTGKHITHIKEKYGHFKISSELRKEIYIILYCLFYLNVTTSYFQGEECFRQIRIERSGYGIYRFILGKKRCLAYRKYLIRYVICKLIGRKWNWAKLFKEKSLDSFIKSSY